MSSRSTKALTCLSAACETPSQMRFGHDSTMTWCARELDQQHWLQSWRSGCQVSLIPVNPIKSRPLRKAKIAPNAGGRGLAGAYTVGFCFSYRIALEPNPWDRCVHADVDLAGLRSGLAHFKNKALNSEKTQAPTKKKDI